MPSPEELARQQIDALLTQCGWAIHSYKQLDLSAARGIAIREVRLKEGRCDLLLIDRKPVGVIEAKKAGITLSKVADQSGQYAVNLPDFLAQLLPTGVEKLPFLTSPLALRLTSATNATRIRAHGESSPFTGPKPSRSGSKNPTPSAVASPRRRSSIPTMAKTSASAASKLLAASSNPSPERNRAPSFQMATGAGKILTACAFTYRHIKHADCAIGRSVAALRPSDRTFDKFLHFQLMPKVLEQQ